MPLLPRTPGLTWRALTVGDVDAWFTLVELIQIHDDERELTTRADTQRVTSQSWVDLSKETLVGIDAGGRFRAIGRVVHRPGPSDRVSVTLVGGVDPEWRGRGVGRELLRWQHERGIERIAEWRAEDPDVGGSFVAVDRSGIEPDVVGYVINAEFVQDWAAQGHTEGCTGLIGVSARWRGRGIARALLQVSARSSPRPATCTPASAWTRTTPPALSRCTRASATSRRTVRRASDSLSTRESRLHSPGSSARNGVSTLTNGVLKQH